MILNVFGGFGRTKKVIKREMILEDFDVNYSLFSDILRPNNKSRTDRLVNNNQNQLLVAVGGCMSCTLLYLLCFNLTCLLILLLQKPFLISTGM